MIDGMTPANSWAIESDMEANTNPPYSSPCDFEYVTLKVSGSSVKCW